MTLDRFDTLMTECREGRVKFYWYLATLAGASLVLIIKFISSITIEDNTSLNLIRISLWLLLSTLGFSAIRNLVSYSVTSLEARYEESGRELSDPEIYKVYQKMRIKMIFRNITGWIAVVSYFLAITFLVICSDRLFL